MKTKIINIVTSAYTDNLDIERLAWELPKSMYEPELFAGLVHRCVMPSCTVIMFASGRIVSTGINDMRFYKSGISSTLQTISHINNTPYTIRDLKIVNMTSLVELGYKIDLNKNLKLFKNATYDPASFPSIIARIKGDNFNGSLLIFSTGKVIITGTKSIKDLEQMKDYLKKKLSLSKPIEI